MKRCIECSFVLFPMVIMLGSLTASRTTAQTLRTLHTFNDGDGANPVAALVLSSNSLYGTTTYGGTASEGTVFKVNVDGSGFTVLHDFGAISMTGTNSDGAEPSARLVLDGIGLYGTTTTGGSSGLGTVFALNTEGTGFRILHNFTGGDDGAGGDGARPKAALVLSSNTLYGTTAYGGTASEGTVFKINTDRTGFSILHAFSGPDGAYPCSGLILTSNRLFGTTRFGGTWGNGTVFALNTDGTGFTNLHHFAPQTGEWGINTDGAQPRTGLVMWNNALYGTTSLGGGFGQGNIFRLNPDSTGFGSLWAFERLEGLLSPPDTFVNYEGAFPNDLTLSGATLYGTGSEGGFWGVGTVFQYRAPYGVFTVLHDFTLNPGPFTETNIDGENPNAVICCGNALYGTTYSGGSGFGTVFGLFLSPPPPLSFMRSESNIVLTWPTDFPGCILQSTTNLTSPIWTRVLPAPVVVNGQNTVTNPIAGTQQFFRLSQ